LFVLPLIDTRSLRRGFIQAWNLWIPGLFGVLLPTPIQGVFGFASTKLSTLNQSGLGPYANLPMDQCAICAQSASFDPSTLTSLNASNTSATVPDAQTSQDDLGASPVHPLNTPYITSCGHTYCYVCVSTAILRTANDEDIPWACIRCSKPVQWIERVEAPIQSVDGGSDFEWTGSELREGSSSSVGSLDFTNSDVGSEQ
jgi:peroxin-2